MPRSDELDYDFLESCGVPQPLVEQMEGLIVDRGAGHQLMLTAVTQALRSDKPLQPWDTLSAAQPTPRSARRRRR